MKFDCGVSQVRPRALFDVIKQRRLMGEGTSLGVPQHLPLCQPQDWVRKCSPSKGQRLLPGDSDIPKRVARLSEWHSGHSIAWRTSGFCLGLGTQRTDVSAMWGMCSSGSLPDHPEKAGTLQEKGSQRLLGRLGKSELIQVAFAN